MKSIMKLIIADTYEDLSRMAADNVLQLVKSIEHPLICTASGDSPAGLYRELVDRGAHKQLDIDPLHFVGLDEWVGMDGNDEGSCRYHLNQQLFYPLKVQEEKICFFNGRAKDLNVECEKVETFIQQHGGIDIAIVGLGLNGHVGMNEPGTPQTIRSHVADIDPLTQQVGQKYFTKKQTLSHGITLGLATIMEARSIFLLVSGSHKAAIVQKILNEEVSGELPAILLRQHPSLMVYLDKEAAALIKPF